VAVDLEHSAHSPRALQATKNIPEANGADVYLLNVVAAAPAIVSQYLHENYEQLTSGQAGKELADLAAGLDLGTGKVSCLIRFGTVYEEVLAAAEVVEADLIITGSHHPNVADYLLGSNASRVVRHSDCSVLVVR
jgi:nucleotide-binding universal stress UspA family protein